METRQRIARRRILSAAVIDDPAHAVPLATALLAGGLDVMEVTFRNTHAAECIRRIRADVPGMWVGAGTILSTAQLDEAMEAGACFGVSPGFNPNVAREAVARNFNFIPGVVTPGEMEQAMELGCPWVKFFPAAAAGGVDFLKSISAPYLHTDLRIIPLGGIDQANMSDYLALPIVSAIGGSWLSDRKLAASHDWSAITDITRKAVAAAMMPANGARRGQPINRNSSEIDVAPNS